MGGGCRCGDRVLASEDWNGWSSGPVSSLRTSPVKRVCGSVQLDQSCLSWVQ